MRTPKPACRTTSRTRTPPVWSTSETRVRTSGSRLTETRCPGGLAGSRSGRPVRAGAAAAGPGLRTLAVPPATDGPCWRRGRPGSAFPGRAGVVGDGRAHVGVAAVAPPGVHAGDVVGGQRPLRYPAPHRPSRIIEARTSLVARQPSARGSASARPCQLGALLRLRWRRSDRRDRSLGRRHRPSRHGPLRSAWFRRRRAQGSK